MVVEDKGWGCCSTYRFELTPMVSEPDGEWKIGKAGLTTSSDVAVVCEYTGIGNLYERQGV